jgi:glycosyltransferase involved in cell wall biosynthesis
MRRYLLKALTFLPSAKLRSFVLPCNPICPAMWGDAGNYNGPLDAVHAMAFPYAWPILCAQRLARRRGVPFLLTPFLHLGDACTRRQYTQPALRWLLKDADRVFVQTNLERDAVLDLGVKQERVVLQGLGVSPAECTGGDREAFRKRLHIAENKVAIGHLANLSAEKGSIDLLAACQQLWNRGIKCRVVLAGPTMKNFRDYFDSFPDQERVITLGEIDDKAKRDFFAGIDIFALPSHSDSFGLVLLEAWANGVPCVAYNAGGPGEVIRHGEDGLLAGNPRELAIALENLIASPPYRCRLGEKGAGRIECEFDWGSKLEIFFNSLRTATARKRSHRSAPLRSRLVVR